MRGLRRPGCIVGLIKQRGCASQGRRSCAALSAAFGPELFLSSLPLGPWPPTAAMLGQQLMKAMLILILVFYVLNSRADCPWPFWGGDSKVAASWRSVPGFLKHLQANEQLLHDAIRDSWLWQLFTLKILLFMFWSWRRVFKGDTVPFRLVVLSRPHILSPCSFLRLFVWTVWEDAVSHTA